MFNKNKGIYKSLFNESLYDIKENLYRYIFFEFVYKGLNVFIILPILLDMFDKLMISFGINSYSRQDFLIFGIDVGSFLGAGFIAFIALVAVFIELGTLTLISHKSYFKKNISTLSAFFITLRKIPFLFGVGTLNLFFYFLIVVPFVGMTIDTPVLKYVSIPKFIEEEIFNSNVFIFVYIIFIIILTFFYIRWIFVINYMVADNCNVSVALKKSKKIAKGFYTKIFIIIFITNIVLPTIMVGIVFLISLLVPYIGNLFGFDFLFLGFTEYFSVFGEKMYMVLSMLTSPLSTILITKIFMYRRKVFNEPIVDNSPKGKVYYKFNYRFKNNLTIIAILIFVMVSTFITLVDLDYKIHNKNISVAGHRGDVLAYPENTIPSIMSAVEKGVDYVEVDLQLTKDGKVVVFHDKNLLRLTGVRGEIKNFNYEDLKNINIKSKEFKKNKEYKIPTLDEVINITKGKVNLLLELKPYDNFNMLSSEVVNIINKHNIKDDVLVQSSNYNSLREIRGIDKSIKIGYIAYILAGDIYSLDVDFYSIEQSILSKSSIKKIRSVNKGIWAWTVNDEIDIYDCLRKDIDGIITDNIVEVNNQINIMKSR